MTVGPDDACPDCGKYPSVARALPMCYDCLSEKVRLNDTEISMLAGYIEAPEERVAELERRVEAFLAGPDHEQSPLF